MAGKWGTAKNGCSVGAFYSSFETRNGGTEGRITSAKVRFKNTVNISDSSNSWEWGGTAVIDGDRGTVSLSGTGERDIQTGIEASWVALGYPGSTVTRTFTATGKGVNYAGGDITVSVSIEYPDRPWQAPAAVTSLAVSRVSDTQQNLSWTRNATSTAPYTSLRVRRRLAATPANLNPSYATIATLAGTATSYADKTTVANAKYDYIVEAVNSTAATASGAVGISTTPAAPTNATVSKSGTTITCGWTDASTYETGFRVERNENGGAYTLLTTTAANAVSAQHTGANAAVTHRFRVAAQAAGGLLSDWLYTDTVALQAPPNAPLVTVPAAIDAATDALVINFTHKPTDATVQTAAEVHWRAVGSPTWTTVTKTTQTSHSIAAGTLSNGVDYEVQARTKGSHATFGAWSASVIVRATTRPVTTVGASGGTVNTARYNLPWTYYQAESEPQQAWQAELVQAGTPIEQREGTGATAAVLLNTALIDDATYTVRVRTLSASGLWSTWDTDTFTVEFLPPPTPVITAVFDPDTGATEVLVTVAAAEEGAEVEPVSVDIYRDGHPLAIGLPIPDEGPVAVMDRIPPLATDVVYRALVWSINSSAGADALVDTRGCCWLFLNGGPDWSVSAKLKGSPAIASGRGRVKVLHHFEDDEDPTEFLSSKARSHRLDVSGKVATFPTGRRAGMGSWADWENVADLPAPVCYRDPLGRKVFVSIGDEVNVSHSSSTDLTDISVSLTKVGGDG